MCSYVLFTIKQEFAESLNYIMGIQSPSKNRKCCHVLLTVLLPVGFSKWEASGMDAMNTFTMRKIKHSKLEEDTNIVQRSFRFCLKDFHS